MTGSQSRIVHAGHQLRRGSLRDGVVIARLIVDKRIFERAHAAVQRGAFMMNDMMNTVSGMGWAMGLVWFLLILVLVLVIAALFKYLFSAR
jgi:hypothetical protein